MRDPQGATACRAASGVNSESTDLIMVHHIKENDVLLGDPHDQSPSKIKPGLMKGASMQSAKAKARVGMGITNELG
jgi:hypothetical protein